MTTQLHRHAMFSRLSAMAGVAVILWMSGCASQSGSAPVADSQTARPVKIGMAAGDPLGERLYSASQNPNPTQDTGVASTN
jgi:hypothetical protein